MSGEQLTPREAALWYRTRRETLRDLEVDFRRYLQAAEEHDVEDLQQLTPREKALWYRTAAVWAHDVVTAALARLDRIVPPVEELPSAPCSVPGVYVTTPLLCGFASGHAGQHSWADIPLPSPLGWWPLWRRP